MTIRQVYENLLTELSKVSSPSILLQDFNYFVNRAIIQYINKRYTIYDTSQQTTDDLRVLKATAILKPEVLKLQLENKNDLDISKLFEGVYEVNLPLDYLHILNCTCVYRTSNGLKCFNGGEIVEFSATKLTADSKSRISNNFYYRPTFERPYYYINNINTSSNLPTNPVNKTDILDSSFSGTDTKIDYIDSSVKEYVTKYKTSSDAKEEQEGSINNEQYEINTFKNTNPDYVIIETTQNKEYNLPRKISLTGISNNSLVNKEAGVRYGNPTNIKMEVRCGKLSNFDLIAVTIDYLKTPQTIKLTQEQLNLTEDTSQILEFPDYVCHQITNELVHIVMDNLADPRLQTHIPVSQSIANPAQQQNNA